MVLADYGSKIIWERIKFLKQLEKVASYFQEYFTNGAEKINLKYKSRIDVNDLPEEEQKILHKIKVNFMEALARKRDEEINRGYTLIGPHVEDISVLLNNKEIKKASSQGQQRTTVISLKMAQSVLLKEEKREEPLLLMDDCFSELDHLRSRQILELIGEKEIQCFITSYERLHIPGDFPVLFFNINKGSIKCG